MIDSGSIGPDKSGVHVRSKRARTLGAIVGHVVDDEVLRKTDLDCGDRVFVETRNSTYSLLAVGDGTFVASGGWFDRMYPVPIVVKVNGCTYGGSVIRHDVVAGRGLFLEFENTVLTTRIQGFRVVRAEENPGGDFTALPS